MSLNVLKKISFFSFLICSSTFANAKTNANSDNRPQVMLKVRFGEVDRLKADRLSCVGLNNVELMKKYGAFKVYSEPTLVALSGETAKFFSGGEMPVMKSQGKFEYQDYGVEISFKPEVTGKKIKVNIDYKLKEIDGNRSHKLPHFVISETATSVLLQQGESFMISGIVKENLDVDALHQEQGFRFNFSAPKVNYSQKEMVLSVTPYIVEPVKHDEIKLPTDDFLVETEINRLLNKKVLLVD